MTPTKLSSVKVGDKLTDIGHDRTLEAIYVHRYDAGDATIVAVTEIERFGVTIGDEPIPLGTRIVREYVGDFRVKVWTIDYTLTHFSNAEIIGATNAHRWEVVE